MKIGRYILLFFLMALSGPSIAKCQVTASQNNLAYGNISPAERQRQMGTILTLPPKKVVVQVDCETASRMRLFVSTHSPAGDQFGFGSRGDMVVTANSAFVDDRAVKLSKVYSVDDAASGAGQSSLMLKVNEGLAFVDGGEVTARNATIIFTVAPTFKKEAITDRTEYAGHLNIRVEAQ